MSKLTISVLLAGTMAMMTPAPAGAATYDKLTYLTFSGPVQIPGATLDAGTYRFRLANPGTSRNVLQVLSHDGSIVYSMFHTTPDSRVETTTDATVTFKETPAGVPPAVKSLFYGGEYNGYEFVYPRGGPMMIAPVASQPEITYTPNAVAMTEPVAEPIAEPIAEPEPAIAEAVPLESEQTPPAELPKTASPLPFVAVGGFASLFVGLGVGLIRRFFN